MRFDHELALNLALSVNLIFYVVAPTTSLHSLPIFLISFFIRTEKVLYFSLFSPILSDGPANSFANSSMMKL